MHHQNPLRKLKDRAQLELWVLGIKNPAGHVTVMVSCPPGGCEVLWLSSDGKQQDSWKNSWSPECSALLVKATDVLHLLGLEDQLKPDRSLLYFWRNKITFSFVFKLDLFKNKTKTHKTGSLQTRFLKGDVIDAARKSSFI